MKARKAAFSHFNHSRPTVSAASFSDCWSSRVAHHSNIQYYSTNYARINKQSEWRFRNDWKRKHSSNSFGQEWINGSVLCGRNEKRPCGVIGNHDNDNDSIIGISNRSWKRRSSALDTERTIERHLVSCCCFWLHSIRSFCFRLWDHAGTCWLNTKPVCFVLFYLPGTKTSLTTKEWAKNRPNDVAFFTSSEPSESLLPIPLITIPTTTMGKRLRTRKKTGSQKLPIIYDSMRKPKQDAEEGDQSGKLIKTRILFIVNIHTILKATKKKFWRKDVGICSCSVVDDWCRYCNKG